MALKKNAPVLTLAMAGAGLIAIGLFLFGKPAYAKYAGVHPEDMGHAGQAWEHMRRMSPKTPLPTWAQLEAVERFQLTEAEKLDLMALNAAVERVKQRYTSGAPLLYV